MTGQDLETFTRQWAEKQARHILAGDQKSARQNEVYWGRTMCAHIENRSQREALDLARAALIQEVIDRAA